MKCLEQAGLNFYMQNIWEQCLKLRLPPYCVQFTFTDLLSAMFLIFIYLFFLQITCARTSPWVSWVKSSWCSSWCPRWAIRSASFNRFKQWSHDSWDYCLNQKWQPRPCGIFVDILYIDSLVQDCCNSSALAMELLQSCTKPSIWKIFGFWKKSWSYVVSLRFEEQLLFFFF